MSDFSPGVGDTQGGFSRRSFLKGSGAAAAATAIAAGPVQAQRTGPEVIEGSTEITLHVNGSERKVTVEPRTTLLDALRYGLDLTGAKPVSIDGSCGASTVWVDDRPVAATTMLALACRGKKIRTVESLGGDNPDPVCKAFVAHDAQQCGFCTPGFVVAVRDFLNKHPQATDAEIRSGLNGNLCRCGTYANVIQAATAVVKGATNG